LSEKSVPFCFSVTCLCLSCGWRLTFAYFTTTLRQEQREQLSRHVNPLRWQAIMCVFLPLRPTVSRPIFLGPPLCLCLIVGAIPYANQNSFHQQQQSQPAIQPSSHCYNNNSSYEKPRNGFLMQTTFPPIAHGQGEC